MIELKRTGWRLYTGYGGEGWKAIICCFNNLLLSFADSGVPTGQLVILIKNSCSINRGVSFDTTLSY